mgnify:CR=1 FL=1
MKRAATFLRRCARACAAVAIVGAALVGASASAANKVAAQARFGAYVAAVDYTYDPDQLLRVMVRNELAKARIEALASLLWTFRPDSWLPHGARKDGTPDQHPVWLTEQDENPNGADVVVLTEGMVTARTEFVRCLDIFDGADEEALGAARGRWKDAKSLGHELHYWQQTETGWQERAL